jgi:hypothetical protein
VLTLSTATGAGANVGIVDTLAVVGERRPMSLSRGITALLAGALVSSASVASAAPIKLFVMAGQSNMVGFGDGAALPPELGNQPDVWYDHYNPDARNGGQYAGATSSIFEALRPMGTNQRYGPEVTFGRALADAFPGQTIAIVKMSQGGTNLFEHWGRGLPADSDPTYAHKSQLYHALLGDLDSSSGTQELAYPDEVTRLDNAIARLEADGLDYELAGFLWMQGENEASGSAAFDYEGLLTGFISDLREDLGAPSLPFVIGRISDNLYASNGGPIPAGGDDQIDAVREAQVAVADADPEVEWVDTDDLDARPNDAWHFSSEAYQTLGQRMADAYIALHPPDNASSSSTTGATGATGATGTTGTSGAGGATGSGAAAGGTASGGSTSSAGGQPAAPGESNGCSVSAPSPKPLASGPYALLAALLGAAIASARRRF